MRHELRSCTTLYSFDRGALLAETAQHKPASALANPQIPLPHLDMGAKKPTVE